ncbi:MAG: RNA polymerase sigma factor [Gaiellaceae bacterium]
MAAVPSIGRASLVEAPHVAPHAVATHGLYERHAAKIQSYCQHQLGSREEAEDAVQTTFMNAFRALGRGVVPEAESAWLFKIAENVCLSRRRSSWRRGKIESPSDFDVIEEVVPGPSRQRDELIGIEDALAAMPEQQRRAILLREWQGLSYREVAEELEISQSAVETLIFRARRSLAQGLEQPDTINKPKRKSFRRALHVLDFGSLVAAAKTLLAGSAAVKATAAAVAVTAAAGTVASVSPQVDQPTPQRASPAKRAVVAPAPAQAPPTAGATLTFSPAAAQAGDSEPNPAVARPRPASPRSPADSLAVPAKAAAAVPATIAAPAHEQPVAEQLTQAPTAEPQQPAAQPVAAAPPAPAPTPAPASAPAPQTTATASSEERQAAGVSDPIARPAIEPQPFSTEPMVPTETIGGGNRGSTTETVEPQVTVPEGDESLALAPAPEASPTPAPAPTTTSPPRTRWGR